MKSTLLILLVFIALSFSAQIANEKVDKNNFYSLDRYFQSEIKHFESDTSKSSIAIANSLKKKYDHWLWFWKSRQNEKGDISVLSKANKEFYEAITGGQTKLKSSGPNFNLCSQNSPNQPNWTLQPAGNKAADSSNNMHSAFIDVVEVNPSNHNEIYAGTLNGSGLFQTLNGGNTWQCISDQNGLMAVGITSVAVDFTGSKTIYMTVANRSHTLNEWSGLSLGVLKKSGTSDWVKINNGLPFDTPALGVFSIQKIKIKPGTSGSSCVLFLLSEKKIYRSDNAGGNWVVAADLTNQVGIGGGLNDIEFLPNNPNIILVSTSDHNAPNYPMRKGARLFMSVDGGQSFTIRPISELNLSDEIIKNGNFNLWGLAAENWSHWGAAHLGATSILGSKCILLTNIHNSTTYLQYNFDMLWPIPRVLTFRTHIKPGAKLFFYTKSDTQSRLIDSLSGPLDTFISFSLEAIEYDFYPNAIRFENKNGEVYLDNISITQGYTSRIEIATTPACPYQFYLAYEQKDALKPFISKFNPVTSQIKPIGQANTNQNGGGWGGDGFGSYEVSQVDSNTMYLGHWAVGRIKVSANGTINGSTNENGTLISFDNNWGNNSNMHCDIRALKVLNSGSSDILYAGTDGGLGKLSNAQSVGTATNVPVTPWKNITGPGLVTLTTSQVSKSPFSNTFLYTAMHNGGWLFNDGGDDLVAGGGDGGVAEMDINRKGQYYYGQSSTSVFGDVFLFPYTRLVKSLPNKLLYSGNGGQLCLNSQYTIVGLLPINKGKIMTFDVQQTDTNRLYAAFFNYDQKLYRFNGSTWNPIGIPGWQPIKDICINQSKPKTVFIARGGYDATNRIHRTNDGGDTWIDYSNGLPPFPVNSLAFDSRTQILYAGTDIGVYYVNTSVNTTPSWQCYNNGMPYCIVNYLDLDLCNNKIYAATYGRGVYEGNLISPDSNKKKIVGPSFFCQGDTNYQSFKVSPKPAGYGNNMWFIIGNGWSFQNGKDTITKTLDSPILVRSSVNSSPTAELRVLTPDGAWCSYTTLVLSKTFASPSTPVIIENSIRVDSCKNILTSNIPNLTNYFQWKIDGQTVQETTQTMTMNNPSSASGSIVQVRACNQCGCSPFSSNFYLVKPISIPTKPSKPLVSGLQMNCTFYISTEQVKGAHQYLWHIYSSANILIYTVTTDSPFVTINDPGIQFYVRVSAKNCKGSSMFSDPSIVTDNSIGVISSIDNTYNHANCEHIVRTNSVKNASKYEWYNGANFLVFSSKNFVNLPIVNSYNIKVKAHNECLKTTTSFSTTKTISSITCCKTCFKNLQGNKSPSAGINIFPNPVKNKLIVELGNEVNVEKQIIIYNHLGQIVKTIPIADMNKITIDLSDLVNGIYTISIPKNKDDYFMEKIIKN